MKGIYKVAIWWCLKYSVLYKIKLRHTHVHMHTHRQRGLVGGGYETYTKTDRKNKKIYPKVLSEPQTKYLLGKSLKSTVSFSKG